MAEQKNVPALRFPGFEGEWKIRKLGEYCKFQQGIQVDVELQKREPFERYIKFLRIENYTQNSSDFRYVPIKLAGTKLLSENEIVMVRYGATAGYIGKGFSGVLANNLFKVIPNQKIFYDDFLFEYLRSYKAFRFFQSEMIGGAMPALSFNIVVVRIKV